MKWINDKQRKAMFANMNMPYGSSMGIDDDHDNVPMVLDVNPLGNMAQGSGLQVAYGPPMRYIGDGDGDGVHDMLDLNPFGSYAEKLEAQMDLHPPTRAPVRDYGDRLADNLVRLYPNGGEQAPIAERMKYFGSGLGGGIATLWPDRIIPNGEPLEQKTARLGDNLGYSISRLYPVPSGSEPLERRVSRMGDGLAFNVARLWP